MVNLGGGRIVIETAPDGAAALAAIEAAAPDLLLLDLEIPVLDGFEVLERLRADPRHRDLPVIVVTGREDVEAVERAFKAGAASFVVKPLNWRLLGHQLRYVRRAAEREDAAARRLQDLAAEGAKFVAQALAHEPALKTAALAFAKAALGALPEDAGAGDAARGQLLLAGRLIA